jgi:hypothetical protein
MRRAMESTPSTASLVTLLLLAAGCRTISTREVSSTPTPSVRVGTHARTWEVRSDGVTLGLVVLFEDGRRAQDSLYVVRNTWHQDLGLIDALGRAYRYLPHHEEPAWVGSGTIAAGAQRIIGAAGECELIEVSVPAAGPPPGSAAGATAEPREDRAESPVRPSDAHHPDGGLPQSR